MPTKFLTFVLYKSPGLREFDANQVPHLCVGKGQQGIKPLPRLSFRQNFPSLRLGEMLAQYLNGGDIGKVAAAIEIGSTQPREKERDCSSKCVIYLGGVITQTNQIVCL